MGKEEVRMEMKFHGVRFIVPSHLQHQEAALFLLELFKQNKPHILFLEFF